MIRERKFDGKVVIRKCWNRPTQTKEKVAIDDSRSEEGEPLSRFIVQKDVSLHQTVFVVHNVKTGGIENFQEVHCA